jgi:phosphoglucomutase
MTFMTARQHYTQWMESSALSESERAELMALENDPKEIEERFFAPLEFGTAGLRGVMQTGLRCMNRHIVRRTTQAFAELVLKEGGGMVAVCYDTRNSSEAFAGEAARVLAANGVRVRLFEGPRPTPELSFAIRRYGCIAGINITASHNPKEYNGYKVYWSDGAQLPTAHAAEVARERDKVSVFEGVRLTDMDEARSKGLITMMGEETDSEYLDAVYSQSLAGAEVRNTARDMKIVYTPFHGCGRELVPRILKRAGFENVIFVEEQMTPDGNFPTVRSPNPEDKEGFALAIELAERAGADLIIGTDPDADRVGIIIRTEDGYQPVSGNLTGVLLLDYIIKARRDNGTMPEKPAFIKTIVTTPMAAAVAEDAGVPWYDTFTGFKFMAEKIRELEADGAKFLLAYEESYGYLAGDQARDKDAVVASMLIAEMAAYYASKGMTLNDAAGTLFEKHGHFGERTVNLVMPGKDGMERMQRLMGRLRGQPPEEIGGFEVVDTRDYLTDSRPPAGMDVLGYTLSDGTLYLVRPSGTEPKLKIYILAKSENAGSCLAKLDGYQAFTMDKLGNL